MVTCWYLVGEDSQSCQVVLDLLEGGQNRLPVFGHRIVVVRPELLDRGMALAAWTSCSDGDEGVRAPGDSGTASLDHSEVLQQIPPPSLPSR